MDQQASLTPKQVAERNGVSESFVGKHIRQGRLKAHRIGGVGPLRITFENERLWVRGQMNEADPEAIGVDPVRSESHAARRRGK